MSHVMSCMGAAVPATSKDLPATRKHSSLCFSHAAVQSIGTLLQLHVIRHAISDRCKPGSMRSKRQM